MKLHLVELHQGCAVQFGELFTHKHPVGYLSAVQIDCLRGKSFVIHFKSVDCCLSCQYNLTAVSFRFSQAIGKGIQANVRTETAFEIGEGDFLFMLCIKFGF